MFHLFCIHAVLCCSVFYYFSCPRVVDETAGMPGGNDGAYSVYRKRAKWTLSDTRRCCVCCSVRCIHVFPHAVSLPHISPALSSPHSPSFFAALQQCGTNFQLMQVRTRSTNAACTTLCVWRSGVCHIVMWLPYL
jgi:hypothetical protein